MPPGRYSSQGAFDVEMLNPQALNTPGGLQTALRAIEAICYRGDPKIADVVEALNSHSHLLEYIISVLEEGAYVKFSKWIIAGFPTSTEPNVNATSMQLLRGFSSSLLSAKYPSTADVLPNLRAFRKKMELSFNILKNLEENTNGALTGGNTSPLRRKKGKAATSIRHIDPLPFDSMGITIPTTDAEVRDVYVEVLGQLRSILEYHLLVLRKPLLMEVFKSLFIKANLPPERVPSPTTEAVVRPDQSQNTAFPMVRPMKTALYFDDIKGFGDWVILLSTRAQKDLRDIKRVDGAIFRTVMKNIEQLSQGRFSDDNQKPLTGPEMEFPIYEAKITEDIRLVYQIDCIPDFRNSRATGSQDERQVIRMFGTFAYAQLIRGRFWDTLSRQLQHRGPDYVERCTFRNEPLSTDDNIILPARFPPLPPFQVEDVPQDEPLAKVREEDIKNIHSMLVLDKFVMLSQALLNSILADKEVAHVFSVSAQEQEIIEHPSSCYVIGRSGTGKTTTMLFKMLAIQHTWKQSPDTGPKPRQVFVTQSRILAMKVEKYFTNLMSSLEAAAHSAEELRMMEKDVEQEIDFVDHDDNEQWRSDLPERFSELSDKHFPLFITYDRLCTMLQNDIERVKRNDGSIIPKRHVLGDEATSPTTPTSSQKSRLRAGSEIWSSFDHMQQSRRNFVSYNVFLTSYWDHLPQTLTRVLDPALVFGEFMGVIKGSEGTIRTKLRCLNRESYKLLSDRTQGTFSHRRDEIYDLFMAYTSLKRQQQHYDAADRTHYILKGLDGIGLVGQKVDCLYVDEVQDNLLIDTLVLRTICPNQHGLFWAGDTAQTISIGSSFRFAELKAYQYRIEKQLSQKLGLFPVEPRTFELFLNYRSHGGIVNCARSIIELILRYWPYSIDALKPERATIDGFRPMFFSGQGNADLEESFFGGDQGGTMEFGADQCILVRDDDARNKLQQKLGNSIIMTLYESKGLEFNDVSLNFHHICLIVDKAKVLLYNFFTDSTANLNQWRLVLNGVPDGDDLFDAPTFDETRHAGICVELKFLYVAITRARNNLWIVDSSRTAEPMKAYWSSKNQIEIWSSTAEVPRLAVSSTSEEWSKTGRTMFFNKRYAQAAIAFQRAGRSREAAICDAYLLREKARLIPTTTNAARTQAFIAAANAFITCARDSPSKQVNERLAYYRAVGDCYSEARNLKKAGDNYQLAKDYTAAARAYREGGYFDEMVEVIAQHGNTLDSGLLERLMTATQLHYFKCLNFKAALKLFPSLEDALKFLEGKNLDEARAKLLQELGRIPEAADIHARNGDMLKALKVLSAPTSCSVDHARQMIEYLLTGLRRSLTLGAPQASSLIASGLLLHADRLDKSVMTKQEIDELAMFKAIQRPDRPSLRTLARAFIGMGNDPAALLCLDYFFSSPLKLRNRPLAEVEVSLYLYLDYVLLLNKLRRDESLAQGSARQRLFGFQVLGKNRYLVQEHTPLYKRLVNQSSSTKRDADGYRCKGDELGRSIADLISSRTSDRTKIQDGTCRNVHGFSPCLQLLVQKKCNPLKATGSCTFQHIQPEELTPDWYHTRLRLILLQIQILDSAHYDDMGVKNHWLGVLYSALHPPSQRLGSLANFDIANMPNGADGLRIVREWVRYICCDPEYNDVPEPTDRFRQWFMVAYTLAFDLDRENARDFFPRKGLFSDIPWPLAPSRKKVDPATRDFLAFVTAEARNSLSSGSSYLRRPVRVDLIVLCDLAERLSGLFIIARGMKSWRGVLHGVTMPRSWFINLILPDTNLRKDTSTLLKFAETMIGLMRQIDVQVQSGGQFIADGSRITSVTGPFYIARICLCLCLMGYNINDDSFKKKALAAIQLLRKEDGKSTPEIYQRYADADDWDGLVHASIESLKHSSLDEMILLVHNTIPGQYEQRPKYVRLVTYSTLDEIPRLLSTTPAALRTGSAAAHQERQRVEVATEVQPDGDGDEQAQEEHVEIPQESIADGKEAEEATSSGDHEEEIDETLENAAKVIQGVYRRHLEQKRQKRAGAARKIQATYRRYLKRKNIVRQGVDATQAHYWHLLRKRSLEMGWSKDSRYYILFRFPLAYILVCLDVIKTFAESEKKDVKERILAEGNKGLEGLMKVLGQHSKLLKETVALQKKLAPSSKFHEGRSVCDLQHAVVDVKAIVESLDSIPGSIETRNRIREYWNEGWKWIFEK